MLGLLVASLAAVTSRANILLLLTDDQDALLGSMEAMPFTHKLLGNGGASMTNFFAHTTVCCPSRGELLTGRYLHNLKAENATVKTCMRLDVTPAFEEKVFAVQLQQAGFATLMAGKYLNGKTVSHCPAPGNTTAVAPPAGWDWYFAMCPDSCYTDCFFSVNGLGKTFDDSKYPNGSNYAPSLIGNVTIHFMEMALTSKTPFFAYVAPHSPHSPSTPAPWYADAFPDTKAPRTLSFNVQAPDHHWAVAVQPKLNMPVEHSIDHLARARLQTLLTVDDTVRAIAGVLEKHNVLDNTYLLFTSDHGFHMGQHCLGACKRQPYDTDIRIPFLIRGPNIAAGSRIGAHTGLPDVAPTILDLAGIGDVPSLGMDGRSMKPLLMANTGVGGARSAAAWRSAYPIEYIATQEGVKADNGHVLDNGNNTFRGIRISNMSTDLAYFEFTDPYADWDFDEPDFFELYDCRQDPEQMRNIFSTSAASLKDELASRLREFYACAGATCP